MPTEVTDPALLAQLNGPVSIVVRGGANSPPAPQPPAAATGSATGSGSVPAGAQEVTDPGLLAQLNAPAPGPAPPQSIGDQLSAGFTSGLNSIPFVGPKVLEGAENAKAFVQNNVYGNKASPAYDPSYQPQTPQDVAASDQQQVDANPVASTIGTVAGTAAPFLFAPELPLIGDAASAALGMSGNLATRMGLGAVSSGLIEGGDALSRGASPTDALQRGLTAGAIGGAFPGAEKLAGAIIRRYTGTAAQAQAEILARAIRDDQIKPSEISAQLKALGPDAMVMDLGPNLQAQAGALASTPGPAQRIVRDAVESRSRGTSGRVADDISATIGNGPDVGVLKDRLIASQSAAADPLYEAVRHVPIEAPAALKSVLQRPMGQEAIRRAADMAANDGFHFPTSGNVMTVGLADYIKRALDDIGSAAARRGENNAARQATNMTRAITSSVDRLLPEYRAAREAFAGHARVLDAVDEGASAFTRETSPAQLRGQLAEMTASERQAFLYGAEAQIEAMMGNAVNDAAALRNIFRKGWNDAKLRMLLGDGVANDLLKRIDRELAFGKTANAVASNSETARRLASQAEINPRLERAPYDVTIPGLVIAAFNKARGAIHGLRQKGTNAALADLLTSRAGQLSQDQLANLTKAGQGPTRARIAAPIPALLEQRAQPIQITVAGGR